jgi:protein lifeguard
LKIYLNNFQNSIMDQKSLLPQTIIQAEQIPIVILSDKMDTTIRQKFITKVYTIVWFQLLLTTIFIGICNQVKPITEFITSKNGLFLNYGCIVSLLTLTIMFMCIPDILKNEKHGKHWLFLTIYTILLVYMMGIVGALFNTQSLLFAGISTLTIFSGLTLYAWQTKYDYTIMGNCLLVLFVGFILMGFFLTYFRNNYINILYSFIGVFIFSFYIIFDTQMIVGGKHRKLMFTVDDYILAAINLYLDILNMFLFILDIINGDCN